MTAHSFADSDQIAPDIKASVCVPDGRKHFLYRQRGIVIQTPEIAPHLICLQTYFTRNVRRFQLCVYLHSAVVVAKAQTELIRKRAGLRPVRAVQSEQTWLFRRAALKRQQLKWNGQTEGEWRCSTDEQYEIIQQ